MLEPDPRDRLQTRHPRTLPQPERIVPHSVRGVAIGSENSPSGGWLLHATSQIRPPQARDCDRIGAHSLDGVEEPVIAGVQLLRCRRRRFGPCSATWSRPDHPSFCSASDHERSGLCCRLSRRDKVVGHQHEARPLLIEASSLQACEASATIAMRSSSSRRPPSTDAVLNYRSRWPSARRLRMPFRFFGGSVSIGLHPGPVIGAQ